MILHWSDLLRFDNQRSTSMIKRLHMDRDQNDDRMWIWSRIVRNAMTMNSQTHWFMRLLLILLFINWFSTVINLYSFSDDYRNQKSIRLRSKAIITLHSSIVHPTLQSLSSTPVPSATHHLTVIPSSTPKKQRTSPFGMKMSVIE